MGLVLGTLFGVGILTCAASLRGEAPTTGLPHWMREIFSYRRAIAVAAVAGLAGGLLAYLLFHNTALAICVGAAGAVIERREEPQRKCRRIRALRFLLSR